MTGFWNSEATSRKMWILSASSSRMWFRRSAAGRVSLPGSGLIVVFCSTAAVGVIFLRGCLRAIKSPRRQIGLQRGVWEIPVSLVVVYPIVRRGAQQHAQQATGMEQQRLIGFYYT